MARAISAFTGPYLTVVPILALALLTVGLERYVDTQVEWSAAQVERAHDLQRALTAQFANVTEAETGQRGYLLTSRDAYLAPYEAARQRIAETAVDLRQLAWPETASRLPELEALIGRKLDEMTRTLVLAGTGRRGAAIDLVNSDLGHQTMEDIRRLVAELDAGNAVKLNEETKHLLDVRAQADLLDDFGILVTLTVAALIGLALRREAKAKERAAGELARLRDEADAANRAKSEFLATMSHEIRTPMNGIIGMNGLLLDTVLSPQQAQYARAVQMSADILLRVVDDILDISRLEAGRVEVEAVDFDLRQMVDMTVSGCAAVAAERGLALRARVDPAVPELLRGDPLRLRQVLLNLLSNAIKFTEKGEVAVTVSADPAGDRSLLRFRVRDTGPGIPAEVQGRLFQKFTQADSSVVRRFGGTGLGLAICRELVTLMGGQIGLASELGQGSEFWFVVPLQPALGLPAAVAPKGPAPARPLCILVVEDNEINQVVARTLLGDMGHRVTLAASGADAIEATRNTRYDLILMDIQMPGMSGIEATPRIRLAHDGNGTTPIIALTAHALAAERHQFLEAGMQDHLAKPISVTRLAEIIERWANRPPDETAH